MGGHRDLPAGHDRPSNPYIQCPSFTLCDAPVYTQVCLGSKLTLCPNPEPPFPNNATCSTSGRTWINPPAGFYCCLSCIPVPADCTIAVEAKAWSGVKGLYRD